MDVDGTMTVYPAGREIDRSPKALLEDLMMEKYRLSREAAWDKVLACGDTETHCLSEFLPQLGISEEAYFRSLQDALKNTVYVPEDTKRLLSFLKEQGFALYTATTNPRFMTLAKLSIGGLADLSGCKYITGYFPGCSFLDPQGKYAPDYYQKIMAAGAFDPATTMMIGDEPLRDCIPAMKAGMRWGINIDRQQKARCIERDGVLYINSFDVLMPLLEKT